MQDIARKDNTITLKSQMSMRPVQTFFTNCSTGSFNKNEKLNIISCERERPHLNPSKVAPVC
jgi:hypothetical protein